MSLLKAEESQDDERERELAKSKGCAERESSSDEYSVSMYGCRCVTHNDFIILLSIV